MQYTIRSVPPQVDRALRRRARMTGRSLNEVALEALMGASGVTAIAPGRAKDLDWFIGGKTLGEPFDRATSWLESVPKDLL